MPYPIFHWPESVHHRTCNCNYTLHALTTHHHNYTSTTLQLQARYTTLHPAFVGEVTDQVTTATIATIPKKTTPTAVRSIGGFALQSVVHNTKQGCRLPIFEISASAALLVWRRYNSYHFYFFSNYSNATGMVQCLQHSSHCSPCRRGLYGSPNSNELNVSTAPLRQLWLAQAGVVKTLINLCGPGCAVGMLSEQEPVA